MGDARTPRRMAKEQTDQRIKELALQQLSAAGAEGLSLRAIARELGLVSSAIYRYYASRDDLLTALILDAYRDLASVIEAAGRDEMSSKQSWVAGCAALRGWACAQPHRFALLYGTVIPGYRAPQDTVEPAAAVVTALLRPVVGGADQDGAEVESLLAGQARHAAVALGFSAGPSSLVAMAGAFSQLIGLLTLELGGHFVGSFDPADDLYSEVVRRAADSMGLA